MVPTSADVLGSLRTALPFTMRPGFAFSPAEVAKVKRVQFSILSPDELVRILLQGADRGL